jgi:hypothetical protein
VQIQNGSATQLIQPSGVLNAASLAAGPNHLCRPQPSERHRVLWLGSHQSSPG